MTIYLSPGEITILLVAGSIMSVLSALGVLVVCNVLKALRRKETGKD